MVVAFTKRALAIAAVMAALCCHCSDDAEAPPSSDPTSIGAQDAASVREASSSSSDASAVTDAAGPDADADVPHDASSVSDASTAADAHDAALSDAGSKHDAAAGPALKPPTGTVSQVQMIGSAGYSHLATLVLLAADEIKNAGASTTAALRLELWLTTAPYASATTGYKPAQYALGSLAPGASLLNVSSGSMPWISPPAGPYYVAIVVTEYTGAASNDGYSHFVHFVFPDLYNES